MHELSEFINENSKYYMETTHVNNYKRFLNVDINYKSEKNTTQEMIIIANGRTLYRFYPPIKEEGTTGKFYNCILPKGIAEVTIKTTLLESDYKITSSIDRVSTEEEKARDFFYNIKENLKQKTKIYYSKIDSTDKAKKLLVTFPGFYYHYKELQYPITTLKEVSSSVIAKLCFQDRYFTEGSYMLCDDNGLPLKNHVIKIIREYATDLKIEEKDIIFFGASKGGTIALSYIDSFIESTFISVVPQLNLDKFRESRKQLNDALLSFFKFNGIKYMEELNINKKLEEVTTRKRGPIHIISGLQDFSSHNGRCVTNSNNYHINLYAFNTKHNSVTGFSNPMWLSLINGDERITIDAYSKSTSLDKNQFTVCASDEVNVFNYSEVQAILRVMDLKTNKNIFSTPMAKLKHKDGRVRRFINAPIEMYEWNYAKYLQEGTYYFTVEIYANNKIYEGVVTNKHKEKILFNKEINEIFTEEK